MDSPQKPFDLKESEQPLDEKSGEPIERLSEFVNVTKESGQLGILQPDMDSHRLDMEESGQLVDTNFEKPGERLSDLVNVTVESGQLEFSRAEIDSPQLDIEEFGRHVDTKFEKPGERLSDLVNVTIESGQLEFSQAEMDSLQESEQLLDAKSGEPIERLFEFVNVTKESGQLGILQPEMNSPRLDMEESGRLVDTKFEKFGERLSDLVNVTVESGQLEFSRAEMDSPQKQLDMEEFGRPVDAKSVKRLSELVNVTVESGQLAVSQTQMDSSLGNANHSSALAVEIDTSRFFTTEQAFHSREEVLDWVKKVGREHGVVVTVRRSDVSSLKRRTPRVILVCERSCNYKPKKNTTPPHAKRRRLATKKCDCPFTLKVSLTNTAERKWGLVVVNGIHNHALSEKFEGNFDMGRLDEEEKLEEMFKSRLDMELGEPVDVELGEPADTRSVELESIDMESRKHVNIESKKLIDPESVEHVDVEFGQTINIECGELVNTESAEHVDREFGQPVSMEFGELVDKEFGEPVDTELGEPFDTESGERVDTKFGESVERFSEFVNVKSGQSEVSQMDSSGVPQGNANHGSALAVEIDTSWFFTTEQAFHSREEVLDWVKKIGHENGVGVTMRRSDVSNPNRTPRVILVCKRSYKSRENTTRPNANKRRSATKKCGCPFTLKVALLNKAEGKWGLEVVNGIHNHLLDMSFKEKIKYSENDTESGEPVHTEFGQPVNMDSAKPVDVEYGEPVDSELRQPVNMESAEPVDKQLGQPINKESAEHVDTEFGQTVNMESAEHVDIEFGPPVNMESEEPVDTEFGQLANIDFGEPVDTRSGEPVYTDDFVNAIDKSRPSGLSQLDSSGDAQEIGNYASTLAVEIDTSHYFTTEQAFNSRDEVLDWAKKTGREHGVVVVVKRSDVSNPKRAPRVILVCERSCSYRPRKNTTQPDSKKRSGTKKCGCPFTLKVVVRSNTEGTWGLVVINGAHNHALDVNFKGHSYKGRLDKDEEEILEGMSKSGVGARAILSQLKARDPTNASTLRTVYNARSKLRKAQAAGWKHIQQLFKLLTEYGYVERHRSVPVTDRVQDLFWTHSQSIQLAKAFPFVFMMDCTYKRNKYCLPLIEIVGVTSTDKTFTVAFVYLQSQKEDSYVWALECFKSLFDNVPLPWVIVTDLDLTLMKAVKQVFPDAHNSICRFHIEKSVLANCIKSFSNEENCNGFLRLFTDIMHASSEEEFKERLYELQTKFCDYPMALNYIHDTWLMNYRTQFVSAWIDQHFHLGNTSTNRAESSHAQLKRHLNSSVQRIVNSFKAIDLLWELQITEIKLSFEDSLTQIPHRFRGPLYKNLIGVVSTAALEKIEVEAAAADSLGTNPAFCSHEARDADFLGIISLDTCSHVARHTLGLPCAHMIVQYRREGRAIPLSDIHSFWKKLTVTPHVEEDTREVTIDTEVDMLRKTFLAATRPQKLEMKKQLQQICKPSGTNLLEPRKLTEVQRKNGNNKRRRSRRYRR